MYSNIIRREVLHFSYDKNIGIRLRQKNLPGVSGLQPIFIIGKNENPRRVPAGANHYKQ